MSISFIKILKLNKRVSKSIDVLIWNSFNSQYLLEILSEKKSCRIVEFSKKRIDIFIDPRFYYIIFVNVLKKRSLSYLYLSTCLKYLKPKIVITYLSNSSFPYKIAEDFKKIKFASVQYTPETPDNILDNYYYYLSWGGMSRIVFEKFKINYSHIYSIGSLKLACYLKSKSKRSSYSYDIGFISTYRLLYENMNFEKFSSQKKVELKDIVSCLNKILKKTNILLQELLFNKYNVCVAMSNTDRTDIESQSEFKYYKQISSKLHLLPKHNLSSYSLSENSKIILTLNSSLGFELVSLGKRVLFLIDDYEFLQQSKVPWGNFDLMYENIPNFLRSSFNFEELYNKIIYLDNLSDDEYFSITNEFRMYYCLNPDNTLELFNNSINEIINS